MIRNEGKICKFLQIGHLSIMTIYLFALELNIG